MGEARMLGPTSVSQDHHDRWANPTGGRDAHCDGSRENCAQVLARTCSMDKASCSAAGSLLIRQRGTAEEVGVPGKPIQEQFGQQVIDTFAEFARSDLKSPTELEGDEFSHVTDATLRRRLSEVFYGVRWIYKLGLALLTKDAERAAHVRAQIVDYASVSEGLLSHFIAHAIRQGHTRGIAYTFRDPDKQLRPITWNAANPEPTLRRQSLWWFIRIARDFGIINSAPRRPSPGFALMLRTAQFLPPTGLSTPGLRPGPFPDRAASLLPGLLAATRTGLTPAGGGELMLGSGQRNRTTSETLGATSWFQQTTTAARGIEFEVPEATRARVSRLVRTAARSTTGCPLFDRLPLWGRRLVPWRRDSDQDSAGGLGWAAQCDQSACLREVDRCVSQGCRAQSVKAETDELVEAPVAEVELLGGPLIGGNPIVFGLVHRASGSVKRAGSSMGCSAHCGRTTVPPFQLGSDRRTQAKTPTPRDRERPTRSPASPRAAPAIPPRQRPGPQPQACRRRGRYERLPARPPPVRRRTGTRHALLPRTKKGLLPQAAHDSHLRG